MRVLLTGGTGMLGTALVKSLANDHEVTATYLQNKVGMDRVTFVRLDLADHDQIRKVVEQAKPDLVIHAAAATDMEWCEAHPEEAIRLNSVATEVVAKEAAGAGARLVYISTDYVFDGKLGGYTEDDDTNPLNVYGVSKLRGEAPVLENGGAVIRTNLFGASKKQSFVASIISNARLGSNVIAAADQFSNPIFVDQAADCIVSLGAACRTGIFNVASVGKASRYEFALTVCDVFGLDRDTIKRAKLGELVKTFGWKAARPVDTSLDVTKVKKLLVIPDIRSSLEEMKRRLGAA